MHVFSVKQQLPVYYRLLPGNIKDATVIIDKGFASENNMNELDTEQLSYIIPLP
jgi:transposase